VVTKYLKNIAGDVDAEAEFIIGARIVDAKLEGII
jgi:hypothetical protein